MGGTGETCRISLTSRCSRQSWYGVGRFLEGVLVAGGAASLAAALRLELDRAGGMGGSVPGGASWRNDLETWTEVTVEVTEVEVTDLSLDLELSLFSRSRVRSLDSRCPAAFSTDFLRRSRAPSRRTAKDGSAFSSPELASPLGGNSIGKCSS